MTVLGGVFSDSTDSHTASCRGVKDGPVTILRARRMILNPRNERLAYPYLIQIATKTLAAFLCHLNVCILVPAAANRLNHDACKRADHRSLISTGGGWVTAGYTVSRMTAPLHFISGIHESIDRREQELKLLPSPTPFHMIILNFTVDGSFFFLLFFPPLFHGDRRQQPNAKVQMRTL